MLRPEGREVDDLMVSVTAITTITPSALFSPMAVSRDQYNTLLWRCNFLPFVSQKTLKELTFFGFLRRLWGIPLDHRLFHGYISMEKSLKICLKKSMDMWCWICFSSGPKSFIKLSFYSCTKWNSQYLQHTAWVKCMQSKFILQMFGLVIMLCVTCVLL